MSALYYLWKEVTKFNPLTLGNTEGLHAFLISNIFTRKPSWYFKLGLLLLRAPPSLNLCIMPSSYIRPWAFRAPFQTKLTNIWKFVAQLCFKRCKAPSIPAGSKEMSSALRTKSFIHCISELGAHGAVYYSAKISITRHNSAVPCSQHQ